MRRSVLAIVLLAVTAAAQSNDWAVLQRLKLQENVAVSLRDGRMVRGKFERWTLSTIDVASAKGIEQITREEVSAIRVEHRGSRRKTAMWGAIIGFGVAFPIGAAAAGQLVDRNNPPASTRIGMGGGFGLFGAGIGAGLGTLAGGSRSEIIYRAP